MFSNGDELQESLPLRLVRPASFPNPARDYYEPLSLDRHLIKRPASTFVLRLASDALGSVGLWEGDELLVDRAIEPAPGRVIVVEVDGERRVGVFRIQRGHAVLASDTEPPLPLSAEVRPFGTATVGIKHLPLEGL